MRALDIELAKESIEALLLLQAVKAWRPGGLLLEGEMHTLVPAVLLRMARLDAFDRDAEPEPPHRQLGEIEQGVGTGKGHAIVGADGQRQAALAGPPVKGGNGRVFRGPAPPFTQEHEAQGVRV